MSVPGDVLAKDQGIRDWCILHAWRGSVAHGMYIPGSDPNSIDDKDTMAICVPPMDHYVGLREYGSRGTVEIKYGEWDIVIYEARKVIRLLAQGNPNVLSLLWLPENLYINRTNAGRLLIDNRTAFTARSVYMSFIGYAKAQMKKMMTGVYQGYMGERRKRLVDEFGYDTKNAAHLIRLLRMGIEFLRDGELIVDRGGYDATELLDIKLGRWTLEQVEEAASRLFERAEETYDRSTLPAKVDRNRVNDLCVDVVREAFEQRGEVL